MNVRLHAESEASETTRAVTTLRNEAPCHICNSALLYTSNLFMVTIHLIAGYPCWRMVWNVSGVNECELWKQNA